MKTHYGELYLLMEVFVRGVLVNSLVTLIRKD